MADGNRGENAVNFVNLLVPGGFATAESWLSPECRYSYGGDLLQGSAIIQCFSDNHEEAKKKFDSIEYIDGVVREIKGNKVWVKVQDRLVRNGKEHLYTDCLVITCNEHIGAGSVTAIEHQPSPEERQKLAEFLK